MELLQLKYFCDAAVTENFSRTARKFYVPPSDISQSIRRLERELSVSLFIRHANNIALSNTGREFYEKVSLALSMIDGAVSALSDDGSIGNISMCVNANRRIVIDAINEFKQRYPGVTFNAKFCCDPTVGSFDLIISTMDMRLSKFARHELITEKTAVAINRSNPLAHVSHFDFGMLSKEPFISMDETNSQYGQLLNQCAKHNFIPNITVQSSDPFYLRQCVEFGLGVALVPMTSWKGHFSQNVVLFPIEDNLRTTYVYTNQGKYMPLCTRHFLELLAQKFAREQEPIEM